MFACEGASGWGSPAGAVPRTPRICVARGRRGGSPAGAVARTPTRFRGRGRRGRGRRRVVACTPTRLLTRGCRGGGRGWIVAPPRVCEREVSGWGIRSRAPCHARVFRAAAVWGTISSPRGGRGTAAAHGQGHVQGQLACTKTTDQLEARSVLPWREDPSPKVMKVEGPPWKEAALTSPRWPGTRVEGG
jgi:hypothetical protein